MAKKKQTNLPKTLYAVRKRDGNVFWMDARESLDDLKDPEVPVQTVGIYQLVERGEILTETKYQRKR